MIPSPPNFLHKLFFTSQKGEPTKHIKPQIEGPTTIARTQNLPNLIIGSSLFLLTYLTLTPLTGAITHSDIQNLTPILKKTKTLWPLLKPILTYQTKLLSI